MSSAAHMVAFCQQVVLTMNAALVMGALQMPFLAAAAAAYGVTHQSMLETSDQETGT